MHLFLFWGEKSEVWVGRRERSKSDYKENLKNWYVLEALSFALSSYLLVFDSITLFIRAI